MYGIGIKKNDWEDYVLPMNDLKTIDQIFFTYTPQEILEKLKQNDSVITETNPELLTIEKYVNGKWREVKKITDETILKFSIEQVLDSKEENKVLHILLNHFRPYLKKNYISSEFKKVIADMELGKEAFLKDFSLLTYEEEREIRIYLSKILEIPKEEKNTKLEEYRLQRKVEEKKAS